MGPCTHVRLGCQRRTYINLRPLSSKYKFPLTKATTTRDRLTLQPQDPGRADEARHLWEKEGEEATVVVQQWYGYIDEYGVDDKERLIPSSHAEDLRRGRNIPLADRLPQVFAALRDVRLAEESESIIPLIKKSWSSSATGQWLYIRRLSMINDISHKQII